MRPYRKIAPSLVTLAGLLGELLGARLGLGQVCDLLDGWLARRLDAVSEFGARLDVRARSSAQAGREAMSSRTCGTIMADT